MALELVWEERVRTASALQGSSGTAAPLRVLRRCSLKKAELRALLLPSSITSANTATSVFTWILPWAGYVHVVAAAANCNACFRLGAQPTHCIRTNLSRRFTSSEAASSTPAPSPHFSSPIIRRHRCRIGAGMWSLCGTCEAPYTLAPPQLIHCQEMCVSARLRKRGGAVQNRS